MKIFITGGGGFIGSHLAIKLFELGHHVLIGDLNPMSEVIQEKMKDYKTIEQQNEFQDRFNLFKIDFKYPNDDQLGIFKDVDLIYHLASPIGVDNIINNSGETLRDSSRINTNIDKIASGFNIPVVYASSSEVFGSQHVTEESIFSIKKFTNSPRWSYAASKVQGEFLFSTGSYPSSIVRFFNVSGPGQNTPGMVIPTFINAAKNNEPLVITENGIRNYYDIRDAIGQIVPIGLNLVVSGHESTYNKKDYNIGSQNVENTIEVQELANIIIDVFKSDSEIVSDESESDILRKRSLEFDDDELNFDIGSYSVRELIESILEFEVYDEIKESEEAYEESLDSILGE